MPPTNPLYRRVLQLVTGSAVIGTGAALCLEADLGMDAVGVLMGGISEASGMTFGTTSIVVSIIVLLGLWAATRERPGLGTFLQPIIGGIAVDVAGGIAPTPTSLAAQVGTLTAGLALISIGVACYVGARLGNAPFDGVPLELASRSRLSVGNAYVAVGVTAFTGGAVLGGPWGPASIVAMVALGPVIGRLLPHFEVPQTAAAPTVRAAIPEQRTGPERIVEKVGS